MIDFMSDYTGTDAGGFTEQAGTAASQTGIAEGKTPPVLTY
jgi:hypothetical protein